MTSVNQFHDVRGGGRVELVRQLVPRVFGRVVLARLPGGFVPVLLGVGALAFRLRHLGTRQSQGLTQHLEVCLR